MSATPGGQTKGRAPSASSTKTGRSAAEGQNQPNSSSVGGGGAQHRSSDNQTIQQNRGGAANEQNGYRGSASADDPNKQNHSADSQSDRSKDFSKQSDQNRNSASTDRNDHRGSASAEDAKQNHSAESQSGEKNDSNRNRSAAGDQSTGNRNVPQTGRSSVSSQGGKTDAGATNITTEEKGRIRSEVSHVNIKEASNIDVHVNIGANVPRTITEYWMPVPREFVEIVPAWRTYRVYVIES
jgi:hypothetical protein